MQSAFPLSRCLLQLSLHDLSFLPHRAHPLGGCAVHIEECKANQRALFRLGCPSILSKTITLRCYETLSFYLHLVEYIRHFHVRWQTRAVESAALLFLVAQNIAKSLVPTFRHFDLLTLSFAGRRLCHPHLPQRLVRPPWRPPLSSRRRASPICATDPVQSLAVDALQKASCECVSHTSKTIPVASILSLPGTEHNRSSRVCSRVIQSLTALITVSRALPSRRDPR